MKLEGTSALITGGRRVGGKLAVMLAERGVSVGMTYFTSRDVIQKTVGSIRSKGGRAEAIAADLRQAQQAQHAVDEVVRLFGRIDIFVNMAGIYYPTPFENLKPSDFDDMIAANLAGPYYAAVAAAQCMVKQPPLEGKLHGKIINVGDWAIDRPYRDYLPYHVAKGGMKTFTLALAKELAPKVTVNMVHPAMIDPPADFSDEVISEVISQTPVGHAGKASDLNNLILYLLEGTDFATGSCYNVDGGRFLGVD